MLSMNTLSLLQNLLLGGLLGIVGQGIRVVAGLKKLQDQSNTNLAENKTFDSRRLNISLFLGFIAGALGIVTAMEDTGAISMNRDIIIRLIGIGYAGVDFVEAFLSKFINSGSPATGQGSESLTTQERSAFDEGIKAWTKIRSMGIQHIEFGQDETPPTPRTS